MFERCATPRRSHHLVVVGVLFVLHAYPSRLSWLKRLPSSPSMISRLTSRYFIITSLSQVPVFYIAILLTLLAIISGFCMRRRNSGYRFEYVILRRLFLG
jgi:hypothetical protein